MPHSESELRNGFTLIELSIVLVIIGLIVGGVLVGQDLIAAAKLRKILNEYDRYQVAVNTFKTKYGCIPGDCIDAVSLWGVHPGGCLYAYPFTSPPYTPTPTSGTCNGDGDGYISGNNSNYGEIFWFWQQLANAGMIEGKYTGAKGAVAWEAYAVVGLNVPRSGYSQLAGWTAYSSIPASADSYSKIGSNIFFLGNTYESNVYGFNQTYGPTFTSFEALSVDQKVDDGKPGAGNVQSLKPAPSPFTPDCATSTDSLTATYNLTNHGQICSFLFNANF